MGCKGEIYCRKYKVRWKGYTSDHDSWIPRSSLHPEAIRDFEIENGFYDFSWAHRCPTCDLACKSARGVQIHQRKAHKEEKSQNFAGTLADKAVKKAKMKA